MSDHSERKKSFCKKYDITIRDESRRFARLSPVNYFVDPMDKAYCEYSVRSESEPLVTLEIPESKLNHIIDLEAMFYNNIDDVNRRRMFEVWYAQQVIEKDLRKKFPTVQAAYEAYSIVLALCTTTPNTFKDL